MANGDTPKDRKKCELLLHRPLYQHQEKVIETTTSMLQLRFLRRSDPHRPEECPYLTCGVMADSFNEDAGEWKDRCMISICPASCLVSIPDRPRVHTRSREQQSCDNSHGLLHKVSETVPGTTQYSWRTGSQFTEFPGLQIWADDAPRRNMRCSRQGQLGWPHTQRVLCLGESCCLERLGCG